MGFAGLVPRRSIKNIDLQAQGTQFYIIVLTRPPEFAEKSSACRRPNTRLNTPLERYGPSAFDHALPTR